MSNNYFQGSVESPYHISIGALVLNDKGEVACHYFDHFEYPTLKADDFYLLMRETLESGETIEQCLARGLREEFGIEAELKDYLGSIVSHYTLPKSKVVVEKTTLYFQCRLVSFDPTRREAGDPEAVSEIRWILPAELSAMMREQGERLGREDVDESIVVGRLL